ncbi:MAG: FAD-dependent oxidoreductase [Rubrivivax sp.]|nr:FAD-dependent oxidoreductase [Rubrivivax sp.]
MKRLLLLGGGHAHVHVLREMGRERFAAAEVTLITPFLRQMYSGMVPGVVAGHYRAEQAAIQLAPLAAEAGVAVLETAAVGLDAARRLVRLANGQVLGYDVLSIDTGSEMDRARLPGARQHALFVRPIEHFLADIDDMLDAAARQPLDVVVIGGGSAGVELALALQFRLGGLGGEPGRVALVVGGERVLAGYPEAVARRAERALDRARVTLFREACVEIRADAVVLASGARVACDAPVLVTGSEAPNWLAGSGLALDGRGFIVTGPTLQSGSHAEVFAAGDVATRIDAPHARSGVYAVRAGPPLLNNLRAFCSGAPLKRHMPQERTLNLISCGRRRAIASWGGWSAEGRWVWWWKNRLDRGFVDRYTKHGTSATGVPAAPPAGAGAAGAAGEVIPSAGTR